MPRLIGPGEVIAGDRALDALYSLPATRVAAIMTPRARANPVVARWLSGTHGYLVRHLAPSWCGEPELSGLAGTLAALADFAPDWIVAIGGGSVLDGARLCWALHEHPRFPTERLAHPMTLPPLRRLCHFAAVPTTAGTGAEASSAAVYSEPLSGRKIAVVTHEFLPDLAILDPRLTFDLSPAWTGLGALDALGHAIEGYTSTLANPLVDPLAAAAVGDLLGGLDAIERAPEDVAARARMQVGACYAGHVQNLRLVGLAHAVAHQLGRHRVPHAFAVGLMLPHAMRWNAAADASLRAAYDRLARAAGLASGDALVAAIAAIPERFGIPTRIGAWPDVPALAGDEALTLARAALDDPIARFLPQRPTPATLAGMVAAAW